MMKGLSSIIIVTYNNIKYTKEQIKGYINDYVNRLFVAEIENKIAGIMLCEFWKRAKHIYLYALVVDKKYQGKRVGTELNDYINEIAKKEKYKWIFMHTEVNNKKMINLLKKNKYKQGKKYYFFSKEI